MTSGFCPLMTRRRRYVPESEWELQSGWPFALPFKVSLQPDLRDGWMNASFGELCQDIMLGRVMCVNGTQASGMFQWACWLIPFTDTTDPLLMVSWGWRGNTHDFILTNIPLIDLSTCCEENVIDLGLKPPVFKRPLVPSSCCWTCQVHVLLLSALSIAMQACSDNSAADLCLFLCSVKTHWNIQAL